MKQAGRNHEKGCNAAAALRGGVLQSLLHSSLPSAGSLMDSTLWFCLGLVFLFFICVNILSPGPKGLSLSFQKCGQPGK